MKRIAFWGFGLIACGTVLAGVWAIAQMHGRSASGPDGETEPSPCLSEATIRVTANPSNITLGQSSVVSWSVGLPNGCSALHVRLNGEAVSRSGSRSVSPPRSTTYTVLVSETRSGVYAQKSESTRVEVAYPPRVVIDPNTLDPVQLLIGALVDSTNEEQTVELCDVDLDLTGHSGIVIGANRSLIASPACARGPRSFGPRIFVTDDHRGRAPLFEIQGDNVLVSGFRLEGPTSGIGTTDDNKEKGIVISPPAGRDPIQSIEISNMEVFHWSGVAVQVTDNVDQAERGRLFNTNERAVRIKNNYFHHNRHYDGEGYGVEVAAGGYALIEQNVFEKNRHAIAGGSKNKKGNDYSGYTARDNLILPGGGMHCKYSWLCWQTHQVDMHGTKGPAYCCGTAGETIIIQRNTILYTGGYGLVTPIHTPIYVNNERVGSWSDGYAIKIRGNPIDKAVVDGNVFKHKSRSDAISQNGSSFWFGKITNPIDVRPNKLFGADPTTELGSCDFFGDGQQDQFMATGVTWWAKSPVTLQWRYLNTMPERLSELKLGDIDGDGVCDVAPRTRRPHELPGLYSKSGTSAWVPLHVIMQ